MTKGVLLFANVNPEIDYLKLAIFTAQRVNHFLKVPVSLVTDNQSLLFEKYANEVKVFDTIINIVDDSENYKIFSDGNTHEKKLPWKNGTRFSCFNLTPYDETLVIDVDYVINSNKLASCFTQNNDFLIYKTSIDLASWRSNKDHKYISDTSVPFYWATVFYFKKTNTVEQLFTLVEHIKDNWSYYKRLYQISSYNFRNDFAFSIAIHMLNGFYTNNFAYSLPGNMYHVLDSDYLIGGNDTTLQFLLEREGSNSQYIPACTHGLDVHVMNKYSLLRFIDNV